MKKTVFATLIVIFCAIQVYGQIDPQRALYLRKAEKYRKMKTTGAVLSVGGTILAVVGIATLANSSTETVTNAYGQTQTVTKGNPVGGALAYLAGASALGAGIPLWIVGAKAESKYNRKLESLTVKLNVSPRAAGLNLSLRF